MQQISAEEREPDPNVIRGGTMLLHPVAIVAVLVLVLNDHFLRGAFPGFVTGKLSDVAGLVFFPLLLAGLLGQLLRRHAAPFVPSAAALTGIAFALVKLTLAGAVAWAWALGAAQWMVGVALMQHPDLRPVSVARDPTDLLALPAVLVAVAIARRPVSLAAPAYRASRILRGRWAPAAMALLMAAATMATQPAPPPPTGVVVSEQVAVTADEIAVRHLTWAVGKPQHPLTKVRLEVSTRSGGDLSPSSSPSVIRPNGQGFDWFERIRIAPDDPQEASDVTHDLFDYEFTTVTLDLTAACQQGCSGGARVLVNATAALVVMRLTTGFANEDSLLSLKADGDGDYTGPVAMADSGAQEAQIELDHVRLSWHGGFTLHLAAASLQQPYTNLRVLLRTRVGGVDDKAGMGADATLKIGTTTMPIDLGGSAHWHDIDVSSRCRAGSACDIPIGLDVVAGPPSPAYIPNVSPLPTPTLGHGVDIYRWSVDLVVQAFDGRQLPADGASITPVVR